MRARILTIIVTYNAMKWVDRCLGSLRASSMPADVFVVDNGSVDGTVEYIQENFPEVILHCAGENLGFGKANNIGIQKAVAEGYDFVYLLNQDAWIFPDTFERLTNAMESDHGCGILSPMQLTATCDKMDPRFVRWCPSLAWSQWLSMTSTTEKSVIEKSVEVSQVEIHPVPFVMAAHWMISRACFTKVGGFSPAFPHYGEDDNYIHRVQYHGFMCGILSSAGAVHDREMRPETKEFRMRLKCVASVVKLSNPFNSFWLRCLLQPLELLAISIRYRSASVFRYIFKLIGSYGRLKAIRAQSKSVGAFL